ncbi:MULTISPECIES: relaxase/mobilization nuclease domain-containing protein [Streptomyces]|uniref:relaxase/mobilization nuclease domain-containing protein n=1 Tax=Streptomyces TaxID=1883 RepID=UPI001E40F48A|nr:MULTISPECIES: relaxase/mobilization nuclease domain-containing protein [Streptomyces]UFQ17113.1 relaxase/mobilization nuclease domain-containing protein [Streptomyces huasconensis]WCL86713.1 relaxase/mobilization nuclease domain-containing protein [Streptomyces sp. JCM 35825]
MIAKISSGKTTAGLIRYLYDTKKAKDHTDPHLVASWDGFAPDPGRSDDFAATKNFLVADLDLHVKQAERLGRAPEKHVWHCSIRAAETDRHLSDEEWADIARRVVAATGIAPTGDPDSCRWVAVRHAPDHIHIAATKVRADLRTARHWNDYLTADRELAAIEKEYGLHQVARGDRTAAKRPTRAEQEKTKRAGQARTARERLRTTVRTAVAAATSTEEFIYLLEHTDGILVDVKHFPSGDVRGYTVALEGDVNAVQEPVWYSGSELSPDLSFPKIRKRLDATEPRQGPRKTNSWHQATAAVERIPHRLEHGEGPAAQAHLAALGEALDALPLRAPQAIQNQLRQASEAFERATRSRIQAEHRHARALRGAVRAMVREPTPKDGTLLAMFLDAAILAVTAAARWHQLRHHDQQVVAAHQALAHLQAAYEQTAIAPLTVLAQRRPPTQVVERHMLLIRQTMPDHAEQVLEDPAFDALAAVLADAEKAGHDPKQLLQQAADQRALDDARRPARVLTWRVERLSTRSAPSAHARAAQAQSAARRSSTLVQSPPAAPAAQPQSPQARRR